MIHSLTNDTTLSKLVKLMPKGYYVLNENGFKIVVENRLNLDRLNQTLSIVEKALLDSKIALEKERVNRELINQGLLKQMEENEKKTSQIKSLKIQRFGLVVLTTIIILIN